MKHQQNATKVAVILVAGMGTRLQGLTKGKPKCLVPVGSETILERAVRQLTAYGVEDIVLATGYAEEAIRHVAQSWPATVSYCMNDQFATTQNAMSLLACKQAVRGRPFFKLDGDLLLMPQVLPRLDAIDDGLAVAVDRSAHLADEEMKVRLVDGTDRIESFGKQLVPSSCHGESIGIERVSGSWCGPLFQALGEAAEQGRTDLYYEDVYSRMCKEGMVARAVDVSDLPWMEVDTMADLERARQLLG